MRRALLLFLVFQVGLGSTSFAVLKDTNQLTTVLSSGDPLSLEQVAVEQLNQELQNAAPDSLPPAGGNPFHLPDSNIEVFSYSGANVEPTLQTYEVTSFTIPAITPGDFYKDVKIGYDSDRKAISFSLFKDGKIIARRNFFGFEPVTMTKHKELLVFVDKLTRHIYAMDLSFASKHAFADPIDIDDIGRLGDGISTEGLKSGFISRGLKPVDLGKILPGAIVPMDISADVALQAGNLILFKDTPQGRVCAGLYESSVIRTIMSTAQSILATLAMAVSPIEGNKLRGTLEEKLKALTSNVAEQTASAQKALENLDDRSKEMLQSFSPAAVNNLLERSFQNLSAKSAKKDTFLASQWLSEFNRIRAEGSKQANNPRVAKINLGAAAYKAGISPLRQEDLMEQEANEDFSPSVRALSEIQRRNLAYISFPKKIALSLLTPKALKIIAAATAGGAALYGVRELIDGVGPLWAVHVVNSLYDRFMFPVMKDAAYRVLSLKSQVSLEQFVPITFMIGAFVAYKKGADWSYLRALSWLGGRIYAAITLPFYNRIADLTNQPNFLRAMQLGISPLQKAPGGIGVLGIARATEYKTKEEVFRENSEALDILAKQDVHDRAVAMALAVTVASDKVNVDPATLVALMEQKTLDAGALEQTLSSEQFRFTRDQIYDELIGVFNEIKSSNDIDFKRLSLDQIEQLYKLAVKTGEAVKTMGPIQARIAEFRTKKQNFKKNLMVGTASLSRNEYNFLTQNNPTEFTAHQAFSQFFLDYSLSNAQIALIGGRADLAHPERLAAQSGQLFFTHPAHRAEMIEQVLIYGVSVPARMSLLFEMLTLPTETAYMPIQDVQLQGTQKTEGYLPGMWAWTKGALNLPKNKIFYYYTKDIMRRVKTFQASLIIGVLPRILSGSQSFGNALISFPMVNMVSTPWFAWPWQPTNKGNQDYEERLEGLAVKLSSAKVNLSQGLDINDLQQIEDGYRELAQLYDNQNVLPANVEERMNATLELLDIMKNQDISEDLNMVQRHTQKVNALAQALIEGDGDHIDQSKLPVLAEYERTGQIDSKVLLQMSAQSLLNYSVLNPPFATKPHRGVHWTTLLAATVSSTYLYTALSVFSNGNFTNWGQRYWAASLITAKFYGLVYGLQKGSEFLFPQVTRLWKFAKENTSEIPSVLSEKALAFVKQVRNIPAHLSALAAYLQEEREVSILRRERLLQIEKEKTSLKENFVASLKCSGALAKLKFKR